MLSSAAMQWIAMLSMLIDHVGLFLSPGQHWMRIVGRLAMPIFALMIAEGFRHTRSVSKYFCRVFITAVLAQIPIYLLFARYHSSGSPVILFGFCLAIISLWGWRKGGWWRLLAIPSAVVAEFLSIDYGAVGVLLPLAFYCIATSFQGAERKIVVARSILNGIAIIIASVFLFVRSWHIFLVYAILAIVPIALYNGKRGRRIPKIIAYGFYPLHLLAIYIVLLATH